MPRNKSLLKKTAAILMVFSAIICVGIIMTYISHSFNYLVAVVSKTVRLVPVYKVDTQQKAIAISFDASWGAEHTLDILDILDKYDVKATFFLVNIWLEDYPAIACEIAARGHEIGLHSATHPHCTQISQTQLEKELTDNFNMIKETTGYTARLFRPPFGDYNNTVISTAQSLGYTPVQWSIDSLDWKDLSAQEIQSRVLKKLSAGDIVLFHNNGKHTAESLEPILQEIINNRGLSVITMSALLLQGNYYIDTAGVQHAK